MSRRIAAVANTLHTCTACVSRLLLELRFTFALSWQKLDSTILCMASLGAEESNRDVFMSHFSAVFERPLHAPFWVCNKVEAGLQIDR